MKLERFFPLNEIDYDASDWQRYFKQFISNGVFVNPTSQLQVIADGTSMKVNVKIGNAYINGILYSLDSDYTLNIGVADGALNRVDRIVVRYDVVGNSVELAVKKGSFASSPVAPAVTRTADMYELALADIRINKGVTKITQADITDLRSNAELCGFVKGLIEEIDTTDLFAQFQSSFDTWFEHMKGQLSTDAAGNLQLQIDDLKKPATWGRLKGV